MKKEKLILPISIILGVIILGAFFYSIQINKQESIERQQRIKLEVEKKADQSKADQAQKEYVAKRKMECYEIQQKERENFSNVDGGFYDEEIDTCVIRFKNLNWKENDPDSCKLFEGLFSDEESDCTIEKHFTKEF